MSSGSNRADRGAFPDPRGARSFLFTRADFDPVSGVASRTPNPISS